MQHWHYEDYRSCRNLVIFLIVCDICMTQIMRLDSSFESLTGLAAGRSGSVADLADEGPRSRAVHRHSYTAPAHNDPDMATPTKPFGLGKLSDILLYLSDLNVYVVN